MAQRFRSPNVILVIMDAMRVDRLSCYGCDRVATPHIDQIANEGVLYEQAFAPDVWTLPVMSSLFAGLMPHVHGVDYEAPRLSDEYRTLASLLADRGYLTWGISANSWVSWVTGLDRGFDRFREVHRLLQGHDSRAAQWANRFYAKYIFSRYDQGAQRINQIARRWLLSRKEARDDRPLFLYLHYMEPHYPYDPPRPYGESLFEDHRLYNAAKRIDHHPLRFLAGKTTLNEEHYRLLNRLYDAEIVYLDAQLGHLDRILRDCGLYETTVLILVADHGENIGDHSLLDHHFCLYDSLLHVPLVIRYPARFTGGQRIGDLVETRRLFRTILKVASVTADCVPGDERGLLPDDLGVGGPGYVKAETSGEFALALRKGSSGDSLLHYPRKLWAVRTAQYKYIESSDGSSELYNVEQDPEELHDVAGEEPREIVTLRELLQHEFPNRPDGGCSARAAPLPNDPVVLERLKSLGYIS
jgi:arylsulfatase A-like enzyme